MSKLSLLLFGLAIILAMCASVDASVAVSGRSLMVNGKPWFAKGVNYGVVPVGQTIGSFNGKSWDWQSTPGVYKRDLPLMQEMGVNTLRIYGWRNSMNHNAFLDECLAKGIHVTIGWTFNFNLFGSSAGRAKMRTDVVNMVKNHAKHPAVLMWAVGNELNASGRGYQSNVWNFIGELRDLIHKTEKAMGTWHPVGSPVADGSNLMGLIKNANSKVDVWMVQLYKGKSFYDFFSKYGATSNKPLFVTEFGVDSYNGAGTSSGESAQRDWNAALWKEIVSNSKIVSGGYVFSFVDSWAKCPGMSKKNHELCPKAAGKRFPGGSVNEEYFGMMAISNSETRSSGVDTLRKKAIFEEFKKLYNKEVTINRLAKIDDELIPMEGFEVEEPIEGMSPVYDGEQDYSDGHKTTSIVIGVVVPGVALIALSAVIGLVIVKKRRSTARQNEGNEIDLSTNPSQAELLKTTPSQAEMSPSRSDSVSSEV